MVLFSGNPRFSNEADAILFLSLISGRKDYLIEHQVKAAAILRKTQLVISTGYMLIESGTETAVQCRKQHLWAGII
jgi:putative glycerol-1-phosphate prenyltransferase